MIDLTNWALMQAKNASEKRELADLGELTDCLEIDDSRAWKNRDYGYILSDWQFKTKIISATLNKYRQNKKAYAKRGQNLADALKEAIGANDEFDCLTRL